MKRAVLRVVLAVLAGVCVGNAESATSPAGNSALAVSYVHWTRAQCAKMDPVPCVPSLVVYVVSSQPGAIGYRVTIAYRTSTGALATQYLYAARQDNLDYITGQPAGFIPWTFAYFDLRTIDSGDITVLGVSALPVQAEAAEVAAPGERQ